MKIAVPVTDDKLCPHFGHCERFALVDVDFQKRAIMQTQMIPSPEHQPGLLPEWLHSLGAAVVIAGGMGQRAQDLFFQKGIRVITGAPSEPPETIVLAYMNDTLKTEENACDHHQC